MADSLTKTKYSGFDFDTLNDELLSRLQVRFAADFNDFAVSSLGIMLLDLTAFGLDALSFYLDRRATDTYLATARTRRSVSRASRQLGYKMGGALASSTDLSVRTDEIYAFNVTIPKGFKFEGPDDLIFEAAESVIFTPAEQGSTAAAKLVPVYEGETIATSFVSDGTANQVFEIAGVPEDKMIVQGATVVSIGGTGWDEVELLEYGETNQFEIGYNDDPPTLRFGDGISGNIPGAGESIDVVYVATRGRSGQVSRNTIVDVATPLVISFQSIPLTLTNPAPSVGGDDLEELEHAKVFAPKVWKTRDVAITKPDYEALAGAFADPLYGRVAVAKALVARSADSDLTLQSLLADIDTTVHSFYTDLATQTEILGAALSSYASAFSALQLYETSSLETDITNETAAMVPEARSIESSVAAIQGHVTSGLAEVAASSATGPEQAAISAYFTAISNDAVSINTNAVSLASRASTISDKVTDTGISGIAGIRALQTVEQGNIASVITGGSASVSTVYTALDVLEDEVADEIGSIVIDTAAIREHVGAMLSADCQVNLVTVPILTKDAGGFYAAPSVGLITALQNYLDLRKEATQTVSVVSGEDYLVPAVIRVHVGIGPGQSTVIRKASVEVAIDGLLRGRKFGKALYESDIDKAVKAIEGVVYSTVIIGGHVVASIDGERSAYWDEVSSSWLYTVAGTAATIDTTRVTDNRNLGILDSEVVTKGGVYISVEVVSEP